MNFNTLSFNIEELKLLSEKLKEIHSIVKLEQVTELRDKFNQEFIDEKISMDLRNILLQILSVKMIQYETEIKVDYTQFLDNDERTFTLYEQEEL